ADAEPCHGCPGDGGGGDINTPPSVGVNNSGVTVNEGEIAINAGTFGDAEGNETVTVTASVGSIKTKDDANGTWSWEFPTKNGPAESQTVTITATDGQSSRSVTFSLTVNNVAPTTEWLEQSPRNVPESDTLYGSNLVVRDPGHETDRPTPNVGCGAGSTLAGVEWIGGVGANGRNDSFYVYCTSGDGPSSPTVSASATDRDGAIGSTATYNVEIQNVSPTAILHAPASMNEGEIATVAFTNQSDVQADTDAGFRYAFDCNGLSLDEATYANSGASASTTCARGDGPATRTVRARIIDKDGGFTEYMKNITVNNVAPTATLAVPSTVNQGDNFTVSLTNVFDPSSADRQSLTYAFDCGDGSGYGAVSSQASRSCLALDKPTMTIKGKVMDKDGGMNEYTRDIAVNNIAPTGTVGINGTAAATNARTVNLALSATDPLPGSGVGHMRFRNENTDTWSEWEPYATSRQWLLSDGEGTKTVHVQFRDNAGNVSTDAISDGIQLDLAAPTGGIKINNGAAKTKSLKVRLALNASDSGSGVSRMCVSNKPGCLAWRPFARSKAWKLSGKKAGVKTVYVRFEDRAGNVSAVYRDAIRYAPKKRR
ncbi:MAG: hypothetical protein ACRDSJ_14955, partial [Rubrobacteraceae bacterium]